MEIEYLPVQVDPVGNKKDAELIEQLKAKCPMGRFRFPVLELEDGQTLISEALSISKFWSYDKCGFYGPSPVDRAKIDQWMDIISLQVAPFAQQLSDQVLGLRESEIRQFSSQCGQFRESLTVFEQHFKLRNFLVGYQLTLADVYLVAVLIAPFQLFIDEKTRKGTFPNLTRYMTLNLNNFHLQKSFGKICFCKTVINPKFDIKIEKAPKAGGADQSKDGGKDQKKQGGDKQSKQPEKAAKEQKKQEPPKPPKEPAEDPVKVWAKSLPEIPFNFYDFKTEYVNAPDKKAVLQDLWKNKWDDNAMAFWLVQYEKYDASEGAQLHRVNNLLNGFMQRMHDQLRPHSLGVFGVYGDEPELEQFGCVLWRGADLPVPMKEHPQFEYWQKKKLNVKDKKDQKVILQYFTSKVGDKVDGR
jgi:glutathione S-transferase